MLICTISVIANVIVLIFHHKNVKIQEMPPWVIAQSKFLKFDIKINFLD